MTWEELPRDLQIQPMPQQWNVSVTPKDHSGSSGFSGSRVESRFYFFLFFFNLSWRFWCPARLENLWTSLFPQLGAGLLPRQTERGDRFHNLLRLQIPVFPSPYCPNFRLTSPALLILGRQSSLQQRAMSHQPCIHPVSVWLSRSEKFTVHEESRKLSNPKQTQRNSRSNQHGLLPNQQAVSLHHSHSTTTT